MGYAENTSVSSDKSRAEIESTLARYGASHFGYATSPDGAEVAFVAEGRRVRFVITLPNRNEHRFTHHARGARTASAAAEHYEQAVRQKWRALALVVKAKLEAVDSGITTFEEEFYAHTVLPSGRTIYEETAVEVAHLIESGSPARLSLEA